jgi:hypothetical protein
VGKKSTPIYIYLKKDYFITLAKKSYGDAQQRAVSFVRFFCKESLLKTLQPYAPFITKVGHGKAKR